MIQIILKLFMFANAAKEILKTITKPECSDEGNVTLHPKNHSTMGKKTKKVNARGATTLYSPVGWLSWEACAQNYEMAKDDEQLLKAWTNTTRGIPWEEKGEAPDWGILFDRREHYRIGSVPNGGYVLTAGVDVQNDRLEIEIVAWGPNKESWSVDCRIIYGSPSEQKTWAALSHI